MPDCEILTQSDAQLDNPSSSTRHLVSGRDRVTGPHRLVERANGYLETSFLPGRVFTSPADSNAQLARWLEQANRRWHRRLEARPADRWDADLAKMVPLPPVSPPAWWRSQVRTGRDHYVRAGTCDYSVHPQAIGRTVTVTVTAGQVSAVAGTTVVARHDRCWARHQTAG